jgi:hypothetical protein
LLSEFLELPKKRVTCQKLLLAMAGTLLAFFSLIKQKMMNKHFSVLIYTRLVLEGHKIARVASARDSTGSLHPSIRQYAHAARAAWSFCP